MLHAVKVCDCCDVNLLLIWMNKLRRLINQASNDQTNFNYFSRLCKINKFKEFHGNLHLELEIIFVKYGKGISIIQSQNMQTHLFHMSETHLGS